MRWPTIAAGSIMSEGRRVDDDDRDPDGPWMKSYQALQSHHKVALAAHLLETTENEIVGALWRLWWAARSEKNPDGVLEGYDPDEIVATMKLTHLDFEAFEIVEVLVNRARLLDLLDGQWRVHNWTVGQRSGAKFKERSEIGIHGTTFGTTASCLTRSLLRRARRPRRDGRTCRRVWLVPEGRASLEEGSLEQGSLEEGSQSREPSLEEGSLKEGSLSGIADEKRDLDEDSLTRSTKERAPSLQQNRGGDDDA